MSSSSTSKTGSGGGKIELILDDPPWLYNNRKTGGERAAGETTVFGGGCQKHYPAIEWRVAKRLGEGWSEKKARETTCLTRLELLEVAEEISSLTEKNAVMFCWMTAPIFATGEGLEYMKRCGFKPKTVAFSWFKLTNDGEDYRFGPGFYTASNLEFCVLGVKGRGLGAPIKKMQPSILYFEDEDHPEHVVLGKRGKHSEKPLIHDVIERMYPNRENGKVEFFAREVYKDWPSFGCEVTGNDILIDLENIRTNGLR